MNQIVRGEIVTVGAGHKSYSDKWTHSVHCIWPIEWTDNNEWFFKKAFRSEPVPKHTVTQFEFADKAWDGRGADQVDISKVCYVTLSYD